MANATIGMVNCPFTGEPAAVRKDKRGHFYYISAAGCIRPSADFGQEWFLEHARIWGDAPAPDSAPDWIVQGKSFAPNTRSRLAGQRKNIPEGAVPVVNPKGTGETGADRPAAPSPIATSAKGPERAAPARTPAPAAKRERNPWALPWGDD